MDLSCISYRMSIVIGPSVNMLASRVASRLNSELIHIEYKIFPDGESYIRYIDDVKGKNLVIIHSCDAPQDKRWMELFFMVKTAKDLGCGRLTAIVPYFGYSRQDRRILHGEAVGSEVIIRLLEAVGVDYFMTFDIHNVSTLSHFKIKAQELSAIPSMGEYLLHLNLNEPFVMTPDDEAPWRAEKVAEIISGDWGYLKKDRDPVTGEITTYFKELPVRDRDVVIVDDVISTGKTMLNAIRIVREQGARNIYVICVFPLLSEDSAKEIFRAGAKAIYGTDCVESKFSVISVAPIIADALEKWDIS